MLTQLICSVPCPSYGDKSQVSISGQRPLLKSEVKFILHQMGRYVHATQNVIGAVIAIHNRRYTN